MIGNGVENPVTVLDKHRNKNRDVDLYHPEFNVYESVRDKLSGFEE